MKETVKRLADVIQIKADGISVSAELIKSSDEFRIYKRSDDVYEVIKVKILPARVIFGDEYPKREGYPNSEDFGKIAWCFTNLENAVDKFNSLTE